MVIRFLIFRLIVFIIYSINDYLRKAWMQCNYETERFMKKLTVYAETDKLYLVQSFIENELVSLGGKNKLNMQISLAVEEVFVNIANYAYDSYVGKVEIIFKFSQTTKMIEIQFVDEGIEFNPLDKKSADITLSAQEREVGGLGIFIANRIMDEISYVREGNKNILVMKKQLI